MPRACGLLTAVLGYTESFESVAGWRGDRWNDPTRHDSLPGTVLRGAQFGRLSTAAAMSIRGVF